MSFHKSPFSGFPFDDDREDQEDPHFRSQLDDIAARHPEFAQHFGSFPFRSAGRTRTQIPDHITNQQRFTDVPFPDRFESFGFPFEEPFREEEPEPYYKRHPKYYPKQNSQEDIAGQSSSNQESQNIEIDSSSVDQQEPERGRRPKQNIQQSNTVDLGQPQEPVDDRNQRSMSAPPPNYRPRFVSSINIPVNQSREKTNIAHDNVQASVHSQPQERVIPIHVEGRDEPVLPKKFASQNTSQPQTHSQPQPCTDKFFTQRTPNFSQYFNRDQQFKNDWLPRGFHAKHPQAESNINQGQRGQSPQPQTKPEPSQQSTNIPKQSESQNMQMKVEREEPKPEELPKPQVSGKADPIDQIKSIQKDVSELMSQVDQFKGKPKDKHYIYLDEMLTRNLIKLDNIDTQGQENIRQARKEAIKCIEKCIGILESKANANVMDEPECKKVMEIESAHSIVEESENKEKAENIDDVAEEEKKMEEESAESPKEEAMDVEPITRGEIEIARTETFGPDQTQLNESEREKKEEKVVETTVEDMKHDMSVVAGSDPEHTSTVIIEQTSSGESEELKNEAFDKKTDNKELDVKSEDAEDIEKCEMEIKNEDDKKEKKKTKKKVEKK